MNHFFDLCARTLVSSRKCRSTVAVVISAVAVLVGSAGVLHAASGLVAAFTYSPSTPVAGSPVSFDGSSSNCAATPCSYTWTDDGDGSTLGTGVQMSFTFQSGGTKFVLSLIHI